MSRSSNHRQSQAVSFHRALMALGGITYLIWWGMVEVLLPGSFNPIYSRLGVVFYCEILWVLSLFVSAISKRISFFSYSCLWLVTLHYFYLLHNNHTDRAWVVGCYITVIAACACLQTELAIVSYSVEVLLLTALISANNQMSDRMIFAPGIITILAFAIFGLRSRVRLLKDTQETSRRFENLFEAAFEGIVVHDCGVIVDINESFAAIFNYPRTELIGMNLSRLIGSESILFEEGPYEAPGYRKDGSPIALEIRSKEYKIHRRALRIVTLCDITARKRSEQDRVLYEASQEAIRIRDEFLSIASHELKTPLTNIKLQTQLVTRVIKKGNLTVLNPDKMLNFIEQTDRQVDRLIHLVEEMLDVSQISSGKLQVYKGNFHLADLVQEVIKTFEATLLQSGSTVQLDLPSQISIYADRFRIGQVISNLLSNAIKYGNGKPIRIQIRQNPNNVTIIIEDQGLGIPQESQVRIFQRFERAISRKKISGFGLGLYICKAIVEAHEGQIQVESVPSQGALFRVTLPITPDTKEVK